MFPEFHLTQIVKDNVAEFSFLRSGVAYYTVTLDRDTETPSVWRFPVPLEEMGGTTFLAEHKAITLMRWIRKALESNPSEFVKTNEKPRRRFRVIWGPDSDRPAGYYVSIPNLSSTDVIEAREIK